MELNSKNIVITSALRTAIGTFNGSLKSMQANELGASIVKASIAKSNLTASWDVDEGTKIKDPIENYKRLDLLKLKISELERDSLLFSCKQAILFNVKSSNNKIPSDINLELIPKFL